MKKERVRQLLLALSLQTKGSYREMMNFIRARKVPSDEDIDKAESQIKCKYVTLLDEEYPSSLKMLRYPPIVLYYYGDLSLAYNEGTSLAVIGSRDYTDYGARATVNMVKELCGDYIIVSGLAKGIDAIAHQETLENKGKTIAVLGSGIDNCYPDENYPLYLDIKEKGLIISEYPNFVGPDAEHFPMRNRIIAGLAKGILITEAKEKSGTLITVSWGQIFNKDIMCIPYPMGQQSGCNLLIKEGAFMVETSEEVRYIMEGVEQLKNH